MFERIRHDLLGWLLCHFLAILSFAALAALAASVVDIEMSAGIGGVFRRELLLTSGAWGSWMFLASARTRPLQLMARFTVLVPGLAMLAMTAFAYHQGYSPDRWVQWLLAGGLCLSLAWRPHAARGAASHPLKFAAGMLLSVGCWVIWLPGAELANDPTMGLWFGAPVVAVLTSTLIPKLIAGAAPNQMLEASTVQV